jgi:lysyl-tRNA synthetase class 2|tara:strand:+ start:38 stop:742 length:705 start_codon:yes stop_codon:yes gene_type:complete
MKFSMQKAFIEKFPDAILGLVHCKDIDNTGKVPEVRALLEKEQERIKKEFDKETLSQNPKIACWRASYASFGAKPKKYRSSVENLYRMSLDNLEIREINKIVDVYNYICLKHMLPVGGDDSDKTDGNVTLKFANGTENFVELGGTELKHPGEGEVIFTDEKDVICRRWNWRQCDKTKIEETSKEVTLQVEALSPFTVEDIQKIIDELASLVEKYCGGTTKTYVVHKDNVEVEVE